MKKILILLVLLLTLCTPVLATDANVQINGETINFINNDGSNANAQIINDRTMVPFRKIFNKLGVNDENIIWNGDTKTVIAKKGNIEIKLQIGSKNAQKIVNGVATNIILDSPAIISNDRTLVPLRFIAESLGKTVGWDSQTKTAIIIDYDYFINRLKEKSESLYSFITKDSSNMLVSITRNYIDNSDSSNNNTAVVKAQIIENKIENQIIQNVTVNFSGTNELMNEIKSEGWSEIKFENAYHEDYFTTKALNDGLKKVYGQEQMKFRYDALDCVGKYNASLYDTFKNICEIDENKINVQTFESRKKEFEELLRLLKNNNGVLTTGNIKSETLAFEYFDITKFDNILYDDSINRAFIFLNSQIFNYDINLEELCYDYPDLNATFRINNSELIIDFILSNEYNEKVQYEIKLNKM